MSLARLACVLVAVISSTVTLPGRPQGPTPADAGDPLSEGALARIGSPRFRIGEPAVGLRCVDGGKSLLVWTYRLAERRNRSHFRLFDAATGKERHRLEAWINVWSSRESITACVSRDGKLLANVEDSHKSGLGASASGS